MLSTLEDAYSSAMEVQLLQEKVNVGSDSVWEDQLVEHSSQKASSVDIELLDDADSSLVLLEGVSVTKGMLFEEIASVVISCNEVDSVVPIAGGIDVNVSKGLE